MLAWIPMAALLAQAGPAVAEDPQVQEPPDLQQVADQLQQLQQQVEAQNQQIEALTQGIQTQQESVTGLQDFQENQVQRLEMREDDRSGRIAVIEDAVEAIRVVQTAVQQGSSDVDGSLRDAIARVDAAAANARSWGMEREASLLMSSRSQLASLPQYLENRNYWEAKIALYTAEREALGAASLMRDVSAPSQ